MKYKAYLIEENEGNFNGQVKELEMPNLDDGNVIIKVHHSSINYKDALASSGARGVVKSYAHFSYFFLTHACDVF